MELSSDVEIRQNLRTAERPPVEEGEVCCLPGTQYEAGHSTGVVQYQGNPGQQVQVGGTAVSHDSVFGLEHEWGGQPVLRARGELQLEFHPALQALDAAQQCVRHSLADLVSPHAIL
jgi:hypothetical protein